MHPIKHLKTILHHRHQVIKVCAKIGIFWQGLRHDLSKFSPTEFWEGAKYYEGFRSPTELARRTNGYSKAWLHHKGRNKHHFEYWYDINPASRNYEPVKMPLRYVKEMFADRIAASKTYLNKDYNDGSALKYFTDHNPRDRMHKETADLLESWLLMLSQKGEKETFKYIKENYKNKKEY